LTGHETKVCGYDMEDLTLVILILGTFFPALFTAIYFKKGVNPVKKARKRNEISVYDNLTDYREVEKATISDILKQKDSQIKSLNARIKQIEPLVEEDQPNKGVSFEEITALVKQTYPQYSTFLPLMKKQIMDITKGMSMEEILNYVKQFTGNKQPQGISDPTSIKYNPNWA